MKMFKIDKMNMFKVAPEQADHNMTTKEEATIEEGNITIKKFHVYLNMR